MMGVDEAPRRTSKGQHGWPAPEPSQREIFVQFENLLVLFAKRHGHPRGHIESSFGMDEEL